MTQRVEGPKVAAAARRFMQHGELPKFDRELTAIAREHPDAAPAISAMLRAAREALR
jgi:hypothetical protein